MIEIFYGILFIILLKSLYLVQMDVNLWVAGSNIAVSIATLILAYFTYLSVKETNKAHRLLNNQNEILNKSNELKKIELDKNMVIDIIKIYFNPLLSEILREEKCLEDKKISFGKLYEKCPLSFPLEQIKNLYDENSFSHLYYLNNIKKLHPLFLEKINRRSKLIWDINNKLVLLERDFQEQKILKSIENLVRKNESVFDEIIDDRHEFIVEKVGFEFYYDDNEENDDDISTNPLHYGEDYLSSYIVKFIHMIITEFFIFPINSEKYEEFPLNPVIFKFKKYKEEILSDNEFKTKIFQKKDAIKIEENLNNLKEVDNTIINECKLIINQYYQEYSLVDKDIVDK